MLCHSIFLWLKNNGRPFFNTSNNEESEFFSINSQSSCSVEHDRDVFTIKTNLTQEEYVLNIQKKDVGYVELFDFQNNKAYSKLTQELLGNAIYIHSGAYINNLNENDNEFYFIYGSLIYSPTVLNAFKFILQKFVFNTKESLENDSDCLKKSSSVFEAYSDIVSCFQTKLKNIICFYSYTIKGSSSKYKNFTIISFDKNLEEKNISEEFSSDHNNYNFFSKCLHYEEEAGVFIYLKNIVSKSNIFYPTFFFKNLTSSNFINSFPEITEVIIDSYNCYEHSMFNDFIRLSERKFIFSGVSEKNTYKYFLYIIMLNIFYNNGNKVKFRLFKINIYELYNYQFYSTIKLHSFNKLLVLASSYCNEEDCNSKTHYTSVIFFSYPNSTDVNSNIIDQLIDYNYLTLDIENNVKIENNIFGFVFSGIIIKSFENCENINFKSSSNNNNITNNYILEKNENIIVNLNFINFERFTCKIEYAFEVTEPDYAEFEKYPVFINDSYGDDEEIFNSQKEIYIGRTSYYNLILDQKLFSNCLNDNCGLCLSDESTCIVCRYNNFTFDEQNKKICLANSQEYSTEDIESNKDETENFHVNENKLTTEMLDKKSNINENELTEMFDKKSNITENELTEMFDKKSNINK